MEIDDEKFDPNVLDLAQTMLEDSDESPKVMETTLCYEVAEYKYFIHFWLYYLTNQTGIQIHKKRKT
jgi:hypothetical protein